MRNADLHIHSNYSNDGEFDVMDIINLCIENRIRTISITDHNCARGIKEALEHSLSAKINLIPGIEIDCIHSNIDLHLLGYNIDWTSEDFIELEKSVDKKVLDSFPEMIENLRRVGIDVISEEVLEKADGALPCAEHIAEALLTNDKYSDNQKLHPYMKGGSRSDMPYLNFYHDYFAQGKPAYVKVDYMSFKDAIEIVKGNNGIPIVAHPGVNLQNNKELIHLLLDNGAEGLEVFNNYHDQQQMEYFAEIARKRKVIMTCGSDFHGKNKPPIQLGNYRFIPRYADYLKQSISLLQTAIHADD